MSEFDKKISALTSGTDSTETDEYVIARGGSNFKISGALVAAAATKLGTIAVGTWQGTAIANAYIATGLDATKLTVGATLPSNVLASSLTSVGTLASLAVSGNTYIATTSGNVGIGTTSPTSYTNYKTLAIVGGSTGAVLDMNTSSGPTGGGLQLAVTSSAVTLDALGPQAGSNASMVFRTGKYGAPSEAMRLDGSGNVGIGVTPSAWGTGSGRKALQLGARGSLAGDDSSVYATLNGYFDGTNWKYIQTAAASNYYQEAGVHVWRNATSGTAGNTITFTESARITAGGSLCVGVTERNPISTGVAGISFDGVTSKGLIVANRDGGDTLAVGRLTDDGDIVSFFQDGAKEGSISVSENTVSYNAFAGSHWSQLEDGSKPDILRGTVIESIDELCEWPDETNERLPKCKVSNTAGSKKVYGVFMGWDNDWTETNDLYVTAVGAFICRISANVTVEHGDLLESNGDGTARVQADDVIRSSTIGKVTSTVKTHEYEDGTYCVPVVLYCG